MGSPPLLSVLDQSPVPEGSSGPDALRNSLDLARLAEDLGYHRYWVAEHHGGPMLAGPSPEVLVAAIGSATERIRVGSGGVMLPHYSPRKVAETFSVLAALFPGRVDLGIGRAPGTDPLTMFALQRDRRQASPDDFPQQLAELLAYLRDDMPSDHPFARLGPLPGAPQAPEPWLLGSSQQSAIWAGELGLPYSFADFINRDGAAIAQLYRERFEPSAWLDEPRLSVGAMVICADTDEEAQRLASSSRMTLSLLREGRLVKVPPPETAERFLAQRVRDGRSGSSGRRGIIGDPMGVRSGIEALVDEYEAQEVVAVTITHDHGARRRSYELVSEAFTRDTAQASPDARPGTA